MSAMAWHSAIADRILPSARNRRASCQRRLTIGESAGFVGSGSPRRDGMASRVTRDCNAGGRSGVAIVRDRGGCDGWPAPVVADRAEGFGREASAASPRPPDDKGPPPVAPEVDRTDLD